MQRVKFGQGEQKKFFKEVLEKINCPSLRELINRGFDIPYSTLKNYYSEVRLLPKDFFDKLCFISEIDFKKFKIEFLEENFGQIIGGKKSQKYRNL